MDAITIVALFAMFSLTVITLAVFARPNTAQAAIKIVGTAFSRLLKHT